MTPSSSAGPAKAKDPELIAFGQHLRILRHERSLTQEALADAAGLHWTYIGQIERGERNLTLKNVLRLARGLGVRPGELVDGIGSDGLSPTSSD
ncbi:helix-turn-helix domain-containing protein [Aquihabitans sp. McL0605]|uniref:helix-turn-helix domain-containing protein n=1 Tax=Aquihabitans sp. McL0605 TaxID=3415671 RepID=UPI003CEFA8A3